MLEILSIAPEDGWAYVRTGKQLRLIRPPYTSTSSAVVSEQAAANSIVRHGFVPPPEGKAQFDSWADLIAFLNSQLAAAWEAKGAELAGDDVGEDLLQFAPNSTLLQFLQRIETELIPGARWDHAEKLLLKMLALPSFRAEAEMAKQAVEMLDHVCRSRNRRQQQKTALAVEDAEFDRVFPQTQERYGKQSVDELSAAVQSRGTVFAFDD